MTDTVVRIYTRTSDGALDDMEEAYDLAAFAGQVPAVGDKILRPGVLANLDRTKPENRRIWEITERIFNPRDLADYIVLVVEERPLDERDWSLV